MAVRSLFTASMAASLFSSTIHANLFARTDYPAEPPCAYPFTSFLYAGCYEDHNHQTLNYNPRLDSQDMTVQKCTASCKANGFRYAGLEYYGECFCGTTVKGAATTQDQCTFPCTGNNDETCGGSDRLSIYMDPTFPPIDETTIVDYSPLGCYTEGYSGRAVAYRQEQLSTTTLTTETCLQACKDGNYPLAATEYAGECFCGVVLGNGSAITPATECDMPCSGDPTQICGGSSRLNIYVAADLKGAEPCGPEVQPPPEPVSSMSSAAASTSTDEAHSSSVESTTTNSDDASSTTSSAIEASATTSGDTSSTTSSVHASSTTTPSDVSSTTPSSLISSSTTSSSSAISSSTTSSCTTSSRTSTSSARSSTTSSCTTSSRTSTSSTRSSTTSFHSSTTLTTSTRSTSVTRCSSVAPAPTCEYGCGKWCSKPIPSFNDNSSCKKAVSVCLLQIADCFENAGWPGSLACFKFGSWCQNVATYCGGCSGGKCTKNDCTSKYPPQDGPSTTAGVCTATTPSVPPATTTHVVPPTVSNICVLPTGSSNSGYSNGQCVGGIKPPVLTCNDLASDWRSNPFKLYNHKDSSQCGSYSRNSVPQACQAACKTQYNSCVNTYAQSCNGKRQTSEQDSYSSASGKCKNQYEDCLEANQKTSGSGRCSSFGQGWD